jgi:hypothetical protein
MTTTSDQHFAVGSLITRREINWGRPVIAWPVYVVRDDDELLVTYTPTGAPFSYASGDYSVQLQHHPWWPKTAWVGHGTLMLQRPGDRYAVWLFWERPGRTFACWYFNLQDPFRRTPIGYDTEDHELDLVQRVDGALSFKDVEAFEELTRLGRYSPARAVGIRELGNELAATINAGAGWWDADWSRWTPPTTWRDPPAVRDDWAEVPWETE